jgi:hypothetical protein
MFEEDPVVTDSSSNAYEINNEALSVKLFKRRLPNGEVMHGTRNRREFPD